MVAGSNPVAVFSAWPKSEDKNLKLLGTKTAFFLIFQGISVARNCLRPETAPVARLSNKGGLLRNFAKTLKGRHFMGHRVADLTFSMTIDF